MKKYFVFIFVVALAFSFVGGVHAQTSNLQKAVEGVKDQLDDLVTAKDQSSPQTLALRIETFGKVIDLSLAEAKDLKVKLLAADNLSDAMKPWQDAMVDRLSRAIERLGNEEQNFGDNGKTFDLATLKTTAQAFKDWRDTNYLPYANQVRDFILVRGEENAVQVAAKRLQKISDDVRKLERARVKNVSQLSALLKKASGLVKESGDADIDVQNRFWEAYVAPMIATSTATSSTASSTDNAVATVSTTTLTSVSTDLSATSSANSSSPISSSTATSSTPTGNAADETSPQPTSIKDLVSASLAKVRGAYQVFIEMSNLVRELLK